MAEPSILTTTPNAVNSPGMPFKTIQVAKGTETTNTANRVAGTYFFTTATHGSFTIGDHVHHTAITKGTQVTDIDTGTGTIYLSKPLAGTLNSGETVTILSDRVGASGGPPAFELKAGTDITVSSAAVNNSGAAILEINAVRRTIAVDTNGDGSANETLASTETLMLKKGTNITLSESGGVVTISSSGGSTLDIDGLSDIGAALVDADTFPVDDGDGGTNRKATMSRLKTYMTTSGLLTVSGNDHRMVRMDGTAAIQDTGMTIDDSDNITGVASLTASATVTAADLTATDDITVGDDLITSDGSIIRPVNKSGTNVTGNTLTLKSGGGTGTASSRIDFFTKSADGSGSTDAFSLSNTIVMKDGRLGIGSGVASDVSGNIITHPLTVAEDTDAEFIAMALSNRSDSNNTNGSVSMLFNLEDTSGNTVDSGKIKVVKNEAFTSTGTTQDSNIEFYTSLNGTLTKRMEVLSDGAKVTGDLAVTGDLNITGDVNSVSVTNLDVDDLTITLAKGAADSAGADGAGFSIDGASASMLYSDTGTKFTINKPLDITGNLNVTGTLTGDTSLTLDSTTITTAEIGVLDSVTAGTATASKALVVDGSKDIGTLGTLTAATITANTTINTPSLSVDSVAVIDTSSSNSQSFAGSAIDLFTYAYGTYRTAKLVGHIHNTSTHETDAFEILVTYDGDTGPTGSGATDVHMTTYAYISSNDTPMGTLAAVKSGSNIAVQFTNTVSNFTGAFSVTATQLIKQ